MVPESADCFKLPEVNIPVVISEESDGFPRDSWRDRRTDQSLHKNFEAFSIAIVNSLFSGAVYSWASDLLAVKYDTAKELKKELKEITLAMVFSVDTLLNAVQL